MFWRMLICRLAVSDHGPSDAGEALLLFVLLLLQLFVYHCVFLTRPPVPDHGPSDAGETVMLSGLLLFYSCLFIILSF